MRLKQVAILQHRLLHYRVGFFEKLRQRCLPLGVNIDLVHGQASPREQLKNDEGSIPWANKVDNYFVELPDRDLAWQCLPRTLRNADLVIVMQENRLLSNYPILLGRLWSQRKVAYWGHGVNFQSDAPDGLRERWKRLLLTRVDWWFAYTSLTRDIVLKAGYPAERITVLDNAIDNQAFRADLESITAEDIADLRAKVSHGDTPRIGLFCGSLYPDKRVSFMIEAADRVHEAIPDFSLVVIGDGPSTDEVQRAATTRPWLHWVGASRGREKAAFFRVADVVFNPGAVGLHVLDSFCAGVPMATTADARHGPEIAYLQDGKNGLIVTGCVSDYANAVVHLLQHRDLHAQLGAGAFASAQRYTLDNMVEQFAKGIEGCLAMAKKR